MAKRSVNKAEIARKTGIRKSRISKLSLNPTTKLQADELYKIALAMNVDPCEILSAVCGHIELGKS